jgi:hypothetical protein
MSMQGSSSLEVILLKGLRIQSISAERFLGMYQAISKEEVLHASEDQDSDQEESSSSDASEDELPAIESDG